MPVLKHAKKKLRQDKTRTLQNKKLKELYKKLVKKANESKSQKTVEEAISSVDKAAKNHIIHANKAARLKASLAKVTMANSKPTAKTPAKGANSAKPTAKKAPAKKPAAKKTSSKKS